MWSKNLQHDSPQLKCALRESNSLQAGLESATLSNEYRAHDSTADYMTDLCRVNRLFA
jgi:hypothetical protein